MLHVLGLTLRYMLVVHLDLLCSKTQGCLGQKCILDFAYDNRYKYSILFRNDCLDLKLLWWFTVDIDSVHGY